MTPKKKAIDLGDLPQSKNENLTEDEAAELAGGLSFKRRSSPPPAPSKGATYIPAPPAPQVPIPYPNGM
jgi:hypothetical protein